MRKKRRKIAQNLQIATVLVLVTGCGVTLSPEKRAPLEISPLETSLPSNGQKVQVQFESTLPGTPLTETVWDNKTGAFADAAESRKIGFTQNYSELIPATALGGVSAGVAVGTQPDYTRIVIPFGRIFEGEFLSGLQSVFPNAVINSKSKDPAETQTQTAEPKKIVSLKVTEFKVWEEPLNHLNMQATVECKVYRPGNNPPEFTFNAHHQATNQSIGSMLSTSGGFIKEMNKVSNRFAGALSEEILKKLLEKIGN
jgi:hypothetical protein